MKRWRCCTVVTIALLCLAIAAQAGAWGGYKTIVKTDYGWVKGYRAENNALVWKGIPYAKPPVGELRWRAPQDPEPWGGIRDATESCSKCTQLYTPSNWIGEDYAVGSEDCLYLDIYRPPFPCRNLPVYVWIHGGSNYFGGAEDYDGSILATKARMVVVVIQYRLGPLGWFAHPALRHGDPLDDSGNFGTLDTMQALTWIKENIRAFGGNPHKITVAGESAGSHNVMNLMISPLAKGLFHRAISESGGMTTTTVAEGEAITNNTIEKVLALDGISWAEWESWSLDEQEAYLRAADAEDILEVLFGSLGTYDAYQDGYVIPGSVVSTIRSGDYNKVPIILGANKYETRAFMPLYGPALGLPWFNLMLVLEGIISSVDLVLPTQFDKDLYEVTGYYGSRNWRAKFVDERAQALREQQRRVYAYQFNWGGPGSGPSPYDFIYGACHATEIPFFFGSDTSLWGYAFSPGNDTEGRVELRDAMMKYVANFARSGNPNGRGLPVWRGWSNREGGPKVILFDADFDKAQLSMSDEEVSIVDEQGKLAAEIASWDPANQAAWGWVPWVFQWQQPE